MSCKPGSNTSEQDHLYSEANTKREEENSHGGQLAAEPFLNRLAAALALDTAIEQTQTDANREPHNRRNNACQYKTRKHEPTRNQTRVAHGSITHRGNHTVSLGHARPPGGTPSVGDPGATARRHVALCVDPGSNIQLPLVPVRSWWHHT